MTDREMLELAAKAAGYIVVGLADEMVAQPGNKAGGLVIRNEHGGDSLWHPRNDDGDALRLAVKLGIQIRQYPIYDLPRFAAYACEAKWDSDAQRAIGAEALVNYDGDPYAATRLAITRAAAGIGRSMK